MQNVARKTIRMVMKIARLVAHLKSAVLLVVVAAAGRAFPVAPVPTVMWDGDFSSLSKTVGGVTYSINNTSSGNSVATDNSYIKVADSDADYAAPTITATGGDAPFGTADGSTVIAFYREMPITEGNNRAVLSLLSPDTYYTGHTHVGVCRLTTNGGGKTAGSFSRDGAWFNNSPITANVFSGGEQMIALTYKSTSMSYYVNGRKIATANPERTFKPTGVCLGGVDYTSSSRFYAMKNMKILGVAIFDRELTETEINEFAFSGWDANNKWRYNDTLAYRGMASESDFAFATYAIVNAAGVADTETFKCKDSAHHNYNSWVKEGAYYAYPGYALFFDQSNCDATANAGFSGMTIGGLNVTAARVTGETPEYYKISSSSSDRQTFFGDPSGIRESYFNFSQSFEVQRDDNNASRYTLLYGRLNFNIEAGQYFKLNTTCQKGATNAVLTAGTVDATAQCLKMSGGGQFHVKQLDASTGCLDYSALDIATQSTTPFIKGNLKVSDATTYKFPIMSGGASFRVAEAVTEDATRISTFAIGDKEYSAPLTFKASSGTVDFPAVATVAEGDLETAKPWSAITWDAKPATIDSTTPVVINVDDDTYLDSATALSFDSLTFNIAEGKTLVFVPQQGLTTANGFTVTGGGTLKIAMNTSITGDMMIADDVTLGYSAEANSLTVNGTLTVASGKTLTLAPVAISETTATLVTATTLTVDGTLAVAAPDSDNTYTLDTATTANSVILKRAPNPAFSYYNSISGGAPSGWGISSWSSNATVDNLRVGPSATMPIVREITTSFHPGNAVTLGGESFSFSVYADVSKIDVVTDKNYVLASIGRGGGTGGNKFVALYRRNNKIMLGNLVNGNWNIGPISVDVPSGGFHLYTAVCGSDGTLALYRDAGTGSGESATVTGGNELSIAASPNAGLQLGNIWGGDGNFLYGTGIALAAAIGFDKPLTAAEVANLAESFPATDGTAIYGDIDNKTSNSATVGSAITVYSGSAAGNQYLGISSGTLTVPADNTVSVPHVRVQNATTGSTTVNVRGTLNVTSESDDPNLAWKDGGTADYLSYKGVLLGNAATSGTGAFNVYGTLDASGTYVQMVNGSTGSQTLTIDGGTLKTKCFYADKVDKATVVLQNNGTLEISTTTDRGQTIAYNLGYGTLKLLGALTLSTNNMFSIACSAASLAQPTTIYPYGNNSTVSIASGTGYVTVADSSTGTKGVVTFLGTGGNVLLTDANYSLIDVSGYTGSVTYQGTTANALAKLSGFAGTVYFTSTVDASAIDLSRATVNVAAGCTCTAIAGQEGTMVLASGATAKLMVTTDVSNYEGYVASVSGSGTLEYWLSDGEQTQLTGEDHLNGNNLLPYYYVWTPSETASENTISANAAARWKVGSLPTANKNVAFKISGATTVLVDATVTYGEVQVYGTGTLTFQSADGAAKMTIARKLQTTSTTAVQIDGGIEFGANAELEVVSTSHACMTAINCGTEAAPYEIPAITGAGIAYVAEGKYLMAAEINVGTFYALGNATVSDSAAIGTLQVQPTGVLTLDSANVSVSGTATIGGTVNVDATSTFIPTKVSGAGSVVWTGKQPDCTKSSSSVWVQSSWSGTNVVVNVGVYNTEIFPQYWGRDGSYIRVTKVMGYIANNETVNAELILDDGEYTTAFQPANGASNDNAVKLRKISGAGTLRDANNNATMHYVIRNATDYSGSIDLSTGSPSRTYVFSSASTTYPSRTTYKGCIYVNSDGYAKIGDGKSWSVESGKAVHILGEVELAGAGSISGPVTVSGTVAKLKLADSALALDSALTLSEGYALEIEPGTIALSETPATLITGLTNTEKPDVTGITVRGCTVSVGGTSGNYTIQATLGSGVWASGDGNWTETSFNGTEQSTDGSAVTFRASANDSVAVTLTGTRAPSTVAFNGGSTTTYTLTGGTFSPSGTVTVESGSVTIESAATGTYVVKDGATLSLANATVTSVSGAGTLNIPAGGVVTISASDAISVGKLTGTGKLVVGANVPSSTLQSLLKATGGEHWEGTLAFSGLTANTATQDFNFSNYGNADSKIQFTNCAISYLDGSSSNFAGELVLCDDASHNPAFATANGYSDKANDVGKLSGNGSISATANPLQIYRFHSASDFTGSITVTPSSYDSSNKKYSGRRIVFGTSPATVDNKSKPASITVDYGVEAGLGEGATWNAAFGIYVSGTLIVYGDSTLISNGTLTDQADATNIPDYKHIVFYNDASLKYKKLATVTMTGDITVAAGSTVNITFGDGVTPVAGTKLISWGGAPDGSFVAVGCTLVKKSDGLYVSGGVDEGTAVVEDTEGVVTIPSGATAVSLAITGGSASLVSTTPLVVNGGGKNVTVYATDANGARTLTDISSAFKVTGENNTYTIELNEEVVQKNVTPTTFAENGTPTLSMTAIPGLWYKVLAADSVDYGALVSPVGGTAVQATEATVSPAAPAFSGTVKFYKIAVGASKAALQ